MREGESEVWTTRLAGGWRCRVREKGLRGDGRNDGEGAMRLGSRAAGVVQGRMVGGVCLCVSSSRSMGWVALGK